MSANEIIASVSRHSSCSHFLSSPDLSLRVNSNLDAADNAEKTQRCRSSKPLVIILVLLDGPNLTTAVNDVQGQDTSYDNGIVSQRGSVGAHGDASADANIPVDKTGANVGIALMKPLGKPRRQRVNLRFRWSTMGEDPGLEVENSLLEEGDTGLDGDMASLEIKVINIIDVLGADNHGLVVRALRVVPHVALSTGADLQTLLFGVLDELSNVVDARRVMDLGHIVAGR